MTTTTLSHHLRALRGTFRTYVGSHSRPSIDTCRNLVDQLTALAERADALEARARDADEMEAVARDLDLVASQAFGSDLVAYAAQGGPSSIGPSTAGPAIGPLTGEVVDLAPALLRERRDVLAQRQAELQAALDAGDEDALAELSATGQVRDLADLILATQPRPRGEVVILPVVSRVRTAQQDGGDAA